MSISLLKELSGPANISKSDSSTAGSTDVAKKANDGKGEVKFSLMRNTINSNGKVGGADVADYLEKAHDLNDEVDSVVYGLETDDGKIVKVYVNAAQADAFEVEMKKMLGMEDDIEEAINELATKFDIVDVIWPKGEGPDAEGGEDDHLDLDDNANVGDPALDNEPAPEEEAPPEDDDDDMDVIAATDDAPDRTGGTGKKVSQTTAPPEEEEVPPEDEEAPAEDEETPPEEEEPEATTADKKGKDKHSNLKSVGKKMGKVGESLDTTSERANTLGENMTIGNKFLQRVLAEGHLEEAAPADKDGVQDGMNIMLDPQQRAIASKLRWKLPKQVVALFAMLGIPGIKLNTEGIVQSIDEAAEMLRTQLTVRRAFLDFYKAYGAATGKAIAEPKAQPVAEGKMKRGNFVQKQLESVLIKLGLPAALVETGGPAVVGNALYKASKVIEDNGDLKTKLRMLAMRMGIKSSDAMAPVEDEAEAVTEDMAMATSGLPAFHAAAKELVKALGVNLDALPNAKTLDRKMQLTNRGDAFNSRAIKQMKYLTSILAKNDKQ
jgi:hypothetical protein